MRVDLPKDNHAILRDPEDVPERLRRRIREAIRPVSAEVLLRQQEVARMDDDPKADDGTIGPKARAMLAIQHAMTNEEADAYQGAADHTIVALVESWSYPQDITIEGVLDLPGRALDILRGAVNPLAAKLYLDTSPSPNPTAPTGGLNGSATPSPEALGTTSLTSSGPTSSSGSA